MHPDVSPYLLFPITLVRPRNRSDRGSRPRRSSGSVRVDDEGGIRGFRSVSVFESGLLDASIGLLPVDIAYLRAFC